MVGESFILVCNKKLISTVTRKIEKLGFTEVLISCQMSDILMSEKYINIKSP